MLYEELIIASQNLNLREFFDGEIVVFENGLYSGIPNQSNEEVFDIEKEIELERHISENELLNTFYSNCTCFGSV
jgi:hypothetical protein